MMGIKNYFELAGAQAAQAHYLWVRASEVIWWEYTTEHYKRVLLL